KVVRYPGGYDTYRSLRAEAIARDDAAKAAARRPPPSTAPATAPAKAAPAKLSYAERRELDGIVDRISEAEALVAKLPGELANPALYSSGKDTLARMRADYDAASADATRLLARWEELEARRASSER